MSFFSNQDDVRCRKRGCDTSNELTVGVAAMMPL